MAPLSWRSRLAWAAAAVAVHVAMLSPLIAKNLLTYGSPLQPGPASTAFMTSYEDFHAYGKPMTWETLRAEWGIRGIINRRLHTGGENLAQVKAFMDPLVLLLASLGAVNMLMLRKEQRLFFAPPLIYWALAFGFYTAVASFSGPGSLPKSLAVLMPFAGILIVDLIASTFRSTILGAIIILCLAALLGQRGYQSSRGSALLWNDTYSHYERLRDLVVRDADSSGVDPQEMVVMARDVWDVYEGTGLRSVMIPNNDLDVILRVAEHYGVDYMLLPAPRRALEDIYLGQTPDSRFHLVAPIEGTDWKLYRLELSSP